MSNEVRESGNTTFCGTLGQAIGKFGNHLIGCVGHVYSDTIGEIVYRVREKHLENRNSKSLSKLSPELIYNEPEGSFRLSNDDTTRHITKFLLFAAGTALFIAGMFFPPVSAIAALTILGIAVTRFIFKAVHIIKQAKVESEISGDYARVSAKHKLIIAAKTMFKLLVAAAEIPAFFFGGPLASLITQPISGAILGIMKAYDDIKIDERIKKELNQLDSYEISDEEDVDDEEENEIELKTGDRKGEEQDVQSSTNSNTSSKGNLTNDMHIDYA